MKNPNGMDASKTVSPGGFSLLVNAGCVLLSLGVPALTAAVIPGVHPFVLIAIALLSAVFFWRIRSAFLQRALDSTGLPAVPSPAAFSGEVQSPSAPIAPEPAAGMDVLSRLIHSAAELDVLLELLFVQTVRLIPARAFRVLYVNHRQGTLEYLFCMEEGRRRTEWEGVSIPLKKDLAGEVVSLGRAICFSDCAEACRTRGLAQRDSPGAWAGVPLPSGATVAGVMVLLRGDPFTDSERNTLQAIAVHAGPALERGILRRQSVLRTDSIETLRRIAHRLIGVTEREKLLDLLLTGARELHPASAAALLLSDSSGGWTLERASDLPQEFLGMRFSGTDHPFVRSAPNDRPGYVDSLPPEDPFRRMWESGGVDFLGAVSLALHKKAQLLGWIILVNAAPLSGEEEALMAAYSDVGSAAYENLRLYSQSDGSLAALADELASLQRLDQELNGATDIRQALAITLDWAVRYTEASAGLAVVPSEEEYEIAAVRGYPEGIQSELHIRLPRGFGGLEETLGLGKAVVRRGEEAASPENGLFPGKKATLTLPICRESRALGALFLESDQPDAFPPAQTAFLERLASHAATAIDNATLYAEVQNANQAKSEFISFVAHELKTPMTSIRGYTDLLAQGAVGPVSPPQANFLATIRANADRMASLVSDLNDISRIESGRLRLEFVSCALPEALEEVLAGLRSQIEAKEQKLTLEIPEDLPAVWVDRGRLIQILANLVSNAHKYTPAGGSIHLSAERTSNLWDLSGPPEVVHCRVQDSGLGISPQEQKNIFQKFFRSEDRTVRDLPGTGLGLHITRNLVEMQGGKIWFESEVRVGTTFHFTVPVASV